MPRKDVSDSEALLLLNLTAEALHRVASANLKMLGACGHLLKAAMDKNIPVGDAVDHLSAGIGHISDANESIGRFNKDMAVLNARIKTAKSLGE
ncbi:MAG: hypothetical protein ACAH83_17350 [Alphaproteobacteria bacterium]